MFNVYILFLIFSKNRKPNLDRSSHPQVVPLSLVYPGDLEHSSEPGSQVPQLPAPEILHP